MVIVPNMPVKVLSTFASYFGLSSLEVYLHDYAHAS